VRPTAEAFAATAMSSLEHVIEINRAAVSDAARIVALTVAGGGVIQAFGTGHSQATAMEVAGRAGGFIPSNRIALSDLAVYGDDPVDTLHDVLLERSPGLAVRLLELADADTRDCFIIASNSGINSSIVDMAIEVKKAGHPLIAITSVNSSLATPARHASGTRLLDYADVVLDNGAPPGDAVLDAGNGHRICGVSSITSAVVIQMVIAEAVGLLQDAGLDAPTYVSANVPDGHERNLILEAEYTGRIRRSAL
jgi:uncharacterized phosphosugar-binding protein